MVDIANAIAATGVSERDKAAVFSVNCPEWMIVLQVWPKQTSLVITNHRPSLLISILSLASERIFINGRKFASQSEGTKFRAG